MWTSVNPLAEREEIVEAAMALSGRHKFSTYFGLDSAVELAETYNKADALGLDLFSIKSIENVNTTEFCDRDLRSRFYNRRTALRK